MNVKVSDFLVTTDDLNQQDWSLFKYFDKLKEEFPDLKVLAFFTPFWKENGLIDSPFYEVERVKELIKKDFLDFLLERKDWLSLGGHGLFHIVPEYSWDIKLQRKSFALSAAIRNYLCSQGIQFQPACKPPFYKFNEIGFELPQHFGFNQLYLEQGIIDFKGGDFLLRDNLNMIDSHVSTGCPMPDRIDKFYPTLRKILKGEIKDKKEFHYG